MAGLTSTGLRIYTTVIALICGAAVAWSIHQSAAAGSWKADARAWHGLVRRTVAHDRLTTAHMRRLVVRYNGLVVRTRRSQRRLLADIAALRGGSTAPVSAPQSAAYTPVAPAAPAPVAAPAPAPPTTHTS